MPAARLCLVGRGKQEQLLRQLIAELHLEGVVFAGAIPRDRIRDLYANADIFINASRGDNMPVSILEAFACGTPAIVHNAGGSREAIDGTGGGIVYESSSELRRALGALAGNGILRKTLGQRARAGYEQYYSQGSYLKRYLDLIEAIGHTKTGQR